MDQSKGQKSKKQAGGHAGRDDGWSTKLKAYKIMWQRMNGNGAIYTARLREQVCG